MTALDALTALGVDPTDSHALLDLARTAPARGVIIVSHPRAVDAPQAVQAAVAPTFTDPTTATLDIHQAVPNDATWSIDEARALILAPAARHPYERNHVIVSATEQMNPRIHSLLLKSIEEPLSDTLFWLTTTTPDALPATLRGRAHRTVHLGTADEATLIAALIDATDCTPHHAGEALSAAAHDLPLARAAVTFDLLPELARYSSIDWRTTTPTLLADELLLLMATLARAATAKRSTLGATPTTGGTLMRADLPKLTREQRARVRQLLTQTLERWQRTIIDPTTLTSTAALQRAQERITTLSNTPSALAWNTPLAPLLASTLATLNRP